ncbi:MAG: integrase core domain-containing protein [Chloroflexota bacterium]
MLFPEFITRHVIRLGPFLIGHLRTWTKPITATPLVGTIVDVTRSRRDLLVENALLRQQLIVLKRQVKRPKLCWRDRAVVVVLASHLATWKDVLLIVKPETVLRWHRDVFRWVWRRRSQPKTVGRPRLPRERVALIRRMAKDNLTWGTERIRGELLKLGWPVAKSTIQHYLKGRRAAGPGSQTWRTFLHHHAEAIWTCDFLQTHDIGFRDIFVFVIIELSSRRVVHVAVTRHPSEVWVAQQLREATPFGEGPRYLIRDNDSKYGTAFDRVAVGAGIKVLHTPIAAPRANAVCERFMGSLRRECLDCLFILSERHLLHTVGDYVQYYNHARPHQGIAQAIPIPIASPTPAHLDAEIIAWPVLHGLHHDYQRRVA